MSLAPGRAVRLNLSLVTPAAALALTLSACSTMAPFGPPPPPPHQAPSPAGLATHDLVTANPDAARILAALRSRGVPLAPSDVSRVDLLAGAPGYAWRLGPRDHLHIHAYRDRQAAAAAAQRFVSTAMSRSQIIDWVGRPHLFDCGTALALYLGEMPQALTMLGASCGAPVWTRP